MAWWAAALLWTALAVPSRSGCDTIDLGHAVPGHRYDYRYFFKNGLAAEMSVASEGSRCGGCPSSSLAYQSLGPGDSTLLTFHYVLEPSDNDTATADIRVVTHQDNHYGLWTYTLRLLRGQPRLARPEQRAIGVTKSKDGRVRGRVALRNLAGQKLRVTAEGAPAAIAFKPRLPLAIGKSASRELSFTCPPESLLQHRSLTFRIVTIDGNDSERISLPIVEQ